MVVTCENCEYFYECEGTCRFPKPSEEWVPDEYEEEPWMPDDEENVEVGV